MQVSLVNPKIDVVVSQVRTRVSLIPTCKQAFIPLGQTKHSNYDEINDSNCGNGKNCFLFSLFQ